MRVSKKRGYYKSKIYRLCKSCGNEILSYPSVDKRFCCDRCRIDYQRFKYNLN